MARRPLWFYLAFVLLAVLRTPQASTVEEVDGNIFLLQENASVQITSVNSDSEPVLSPDGKWIAFVRTDIARSVDLDREPAYKDLYIVPSMGGAARLLIGRGTPCGQNEFLADFWSLAFLSDGVRLAFQSSWGAVHGSTHLVNIETGECRFVAPGNRVYVVKRGDYRDHLIISLRKYFMPTGSYNWWWLVDLNGKEIGPVTEDRHEESMSELDEFQEVYERDP